ncbi:MAG: hypothetical protein GY810_30585, partial [Aureispira sp.]|nr:hypothetical protein [Aureispira sp.]
MRFKLIKIKCLLFILMGLNLSVYGQSPFQKLYPDSCVISIYSYAGGDGGRRNYKGLSNIQYYWSKSSSITFHFNKKKEQYIATSFRKKRANAYQIHYDSLLQSPLNYSRKKCTHKAISLEEINELLALLYTKPDTLTASKLGISKNFKPHIHRRTLKKLFNKQYIPARKYYNRELDRETGTSIFRSRLKEFKNYRHIDSINLFLAGEMIPEDFGPTIRSSGSASITFSIEYKNKTYDFSKSLYSSYNGLWRRYLTIFQTKGTHSPKIDYLIHKFLPNGFYKKKKLGNF